MGSPLPPDPYAALGCTKDEAAASIKQKYRKLVLRYHPDKVQDESQKQAAADVFHKIQTAYEIIGDEARRARYDAQCKLAELRKEMMERAGAERRRSADDRSTAYGGYMERPRGDYYADRSRTTPQYEERKPSYAHQADYFEPVPRPAARKTEEYERSSKRTSPRDERPRSKTSRDAKESERSSRKEKTRKTERDVRRERDRKYERPKVDEVSSDDSDEYERVRKPTREEDATPLRRPREDYFDMGRRQSAPSHYADEKLSSQQKYLREYIERSRGGGRTTSETRRPSPKRTMSSRENVERVKRPTEDVYTIRRGSGERPRIVTRDSESRRTREPDNVDASRDMDSRRPATLSQSKSSPAEIRIPLGDRGRSFSVQHGDSKASNDPPIPQMRRAETMPQPLSSGTTTVRPDSRRKDPTIPSKSSRLNPQAYPSPESSPDPPLRRRFDYSRTEYADEDESASPQEDHRGHGYQAELRESVFTRPRYTRSPSPSNIREPTTTSKDRRSASTKYASTTPSQAPPPLPRTTSHSWIYPGHGHGVESYSVSAAAAAAPPASNITSNNNNINNKPSIHRENSSRNASGNISGLYGEIPTTNTNTSTSPIATAFAAASTRTSPRLPHNRSSPPTMDPAAIPNLTREVRPEDVRYASHGPEASTLKTGRASREKDRGGRSSGGGHGHGGGGGERVVGRGWGIRA